MGKGSRDFRLTRSLQARKPPMDDSPHMNDSEARPQSASPDLRSRFLPA
jgi:hypothetical protein